MGNTNAPGALPPDPVLAPAPKSRLGLIAGVLAVVAVLGIGTFVAYKMFFAKDATPVVTTEPAKSDAATAPPADAAKDSSATAGQGAGGGSNMSAPTGSPADAAAQAAAAAEAAKAAAPGTPPTPADAAAAKAAAAKSAAAAAAKADGNKAPPVGGAPSASPPTAAPAPAVQHAATPAAAAHAPTVDRWEQMRQAYAVCDREGFFDKIACNSRVGKQYCEGYWGKVPQCPVGAYGDRAN